MEDRTHARIDRWLKSFTKLNDGVTAIEYSLIGGLISIFIIIGLSLVGDQVQTTFDTWTSAVQGAVRESQGS